MHPSSYHTCCWAGCTHERSEGSGFCIEHKRAMRTYGQVETRQPEPVYTACCCGAPLKPGQVLCDPCEAREWPRFAR